jgi:hypothetical protein
MIVGTGKVCASGLSGHECVFDDDTGADEEEQLEKETEQPEPCSGHPAVAARQRLQQLAQGKATRQIYFEDEKEDSL